MARIILKPKDDNLKPKDDKKGYIQLESGADNDAISLVVALDDKDDDSPYTLTACTIKLPVSIFKNDPEKGKGLEAKWGSTTVGVTISEDKHHSDFYDFKLTVPAGSTLSKDKSINIELPAIDVTNNAGASGDIAIVLVYDDLGDDEHFDSNTLKVTVLNTKKGSSSASISISTPAVNSDRNKKEDKDNLQNFIYPSIWENDRLILPINNTLSFTFTWNPPGSGSKSKPEKSKAEKSKAGQFLITFDYGSQIHLAPNQLVCNSLSSRNTEKYLNVYAWKASLKEFYYTSGKSTEDITWNLSVNSEHNDKPLGAWILKISDDSADVNWKENFSITLHFSTLISTNTASDPLPSNIYIQSTGVEDMRDTIGATSLNISTAPPQSFLFENKSGSKVDFDYSLFRASFGLLTWKDQNGKYELKNKETDKVRTGDFIEKRRIVFPTHAEGKSSALQFDDSKTWGLVYEGSADSILTQKENPQLLLTPINGSANPIEVGTHRRVINISSKPIFPNDHPTFEIVANSVKNLGQVTKGGTTYTLLSWHATGLTTDGYCTLSNKPGTQLKGSRNAGADPYYYLYPSKDVSNLTLTAKTSGDEGSTKSYPIPSTVSAPDFPTLDIDMCTLNGHLYVVYNTGAAIMLQSSMNGVEWSNPQNLSSQYDIPLGIPSITTDGEKLYIVIYNTRGANFWYRDATNKWQEDHSKEFIVTRTQPKHMQMRYLAQENTTGFYATYYYGDNQAANLTSIMASPIQFLNNVKNGMSFIWFKDYYYLAFQNTSDTLSLVRNSIFYDKHYTSADINLPSDNYISGITQMAVFHDKLVIVFSKLGTNQLCYIYSSDGRTWSAIHTLSLTAKAFVVSNFYNLLYISYVTATSPAAFSNYLLVKSDVE